MLGKNLKVPITKGILTSFHWVIGGKVLVVIAGDDNYKDSAEEQGSFLSRWARRKVSSQFSEEYLDGRQSFIFSWDDGHRPIHEEALLHYFDPHKEEKKFVPEKKTEVAVTQAFPKQVCLCACNLWNFGNTIFKKSIFSGTSRYSRTDDFEHFLEQTYRLIFPNSGTENQNVTNSVIVIV